MTAIQAVEQAQQPPKPAVKKPIKQLSDTDPQSIYDPKNLSTDERKVTNSLFCIECFNRYLLLPLLLDNKFDASSSDSFLQAEK